MKTIQIIRRAKTAASNIKNLPREKLLSEFVNETKRRQIEWTAKGSPITPAELADGLAKEWKWNGFVYRGAGITFQQLLHAGIEALRDPSGVEDLPPIVQRIVDHVGRNAKCPCGSGKKYKKCCGRGEA